MTEQPTGPSEPAPSRPMPRLGRGGRWSAHLDRPIPPTEPYQPKPRTRPAGGWAKTGDVGATARLGDDEQPVMVEARPYGGANSQPRRNLEQLGVAAMHTCADHCQCDQAQCTSCADTGHVCENHPDRPWAGVSDDINACDCGGAGIPCPDCCDPIPEDGSTSIGAAFVPRKFAIGEFGCPDGPLSNRVPLGDLVPGLRRLDDPPSPAELLAMADDLNAHGGVDETFVAELLQHAAALHEVAPLTAAARAWDTNLVAPAPRRDPLDLVRERLSLAPDETLVPPVLQATTADAPAKHEHVWTMTSPVRCVECRRYLRPWWRRVLDRARRR